MSTTPLRGRGRPFKFISELTSMDLSVNENGSAQVTPSQSPSEITALNGQNGSVQGGGDASSSPVSTQQTSQTGSSTGASQNGLSPGGQSSGGGAGGKQSDPTDPATLMADVHDEQSLSLAVEMAAVNQAIIALSGQTPIAIKAEKPDVPPASSSS